MLQTRNNRFKKGTLSKEAYNVIMYDLECLDLKRTEDNKYHFRLLVENLNDIFGIRNVNKWIKEDMNEKGD